MLHGPVVDPYGAVIYLELWGVGAGAFFLASDRESVAGAGFLVGSGSGRIFSRSRRFLSDSVSCAGMKCMTFSTGAGLGYAAELFGGDPDFGAGP